MTSSTIFLNGRNWTMGELEVTLQMYDKLVAFVESEHDRLSGDAQ